MRTSIKSASYAAVAAFGVAAGASVFFTEDEPGEVPAHPRTHAAEANAHPAGGGEPTLGTVWRAADASPPGPRGVPGRADPLDADYLRRQLGDVRLRADGTVRLDDTARKALERTLDDPRLVLLPADLARMQAIIREAVPGPAGVQTASTVADYYRYAQAKHRLAEATGRIAPGDAMEQYDALVAVRERTLGRTVSDQLFYKADRDARFMIESASLAAEADVTAEKRAAAQAALAVRYDQNAPPIEDWPERRAAFAAARSEIDRSASMTPEERAAARRALFAEHFDDDERAVLADWRAGPDDDEPSG